jgi:sulfur-oxidizing protein SoxY
MWQVISLTLLLLAALPASAEVDEAARATRWAELRAAMFGDREVQDGGDLVRIDAPERAEDAALVPVTFVLDNRIAGNVRQLYFVIDDNPSPLAGLFRFGPLADPRVLTTRVRVDDYTYMHAVAETADGSLYATARFIKAAGGCSAPAGKDQALAVQRLGKMKLTYRSGADFDKPVAAQLLISHPNNSGLQMDQLTRNFIPADFIQSIKITYNGEAVLSVESDISLSEDPSVGFQFVPLAPGSLAVEVDDSMQRHFTQGWPLQPPGRM